MQAPAAAHPFPTFEQVAVWLQQAPVIAQSLSTEQDLVQKSFPDGSCQQSKPAVTQACPPLQPAYAAPLYGEQT